MKSHSYIAEICCGSYYDAICAIKGGARRIELNSALTLGGLTASTATLQLIKQYDATLQVISMVRPRAAGFCYSDLEFRVMKEECKELLCKGADGIAFGCLTPDASLDLEKNKELIAIIHASGKEAVFHRAFDCCSNPFQTIEQLIELGVQRVLTSGLAPKALEGKAILKELQKNYGHEIEILAGSGVNASNALELIQETGIYQVHSSCKDYQCDPTTNANNVSYSIYTGELSLMYDVVSESKVKELVQLVNQLNKN